MYERIDTLPSGVISQPEPAVDGSNQDKAIAFQDEFFEKSGRLPTYKQVAAHVDRSIATLYHWRRFRAARDALIAKGAPSNRGWRNTRHEEKAILFQEEVFKRSGRLPTLHQVATYLDRKRCPGAKRWSRFWALRRAAKKDGAPDNRVGRPTGKENEAISFQRAVFEQSGRLPTYDDIGTHVGVDPRNIPRWARFRAARCGLEKKGAPSNRGARPTGKENEAISFLHAAFEESERIPSYREVADHFGVYISTVRRWKRFMSKRHELIAGMYSTMTPWGRASHFREAEAIVRLQEMLQTSRRIPSPDDLAENLGVAVQVLNLWPTFRRAYTALGNGNARLDAKPNGKVNGSAAERPTPTDNVPGPPAAGRSTGNKGGRHREWEDLWTLIQEADKRDPKPKDQAIAGEHNRRFGRAIGEGKRKKADAKTVIWVRRDYKRDAR